MTLEILSFLVSTVTAVCALYLSYVALQHSAKPKIAIQMASTRLVEIGKEAVFRFRLVNVGHWYAKPSAVDIMVFCNFDPAFELESIHYGSVQEYENAEVRQGVGGFNFLKAKGIKLGTGEDGEEVHVKLTTPTMPGVYLVRISALSEGGVSEKGEFKIKCVENIET